MASVHVEDVFFRVHEGLPRQGPGNKACTARAMSLIPSLPATPRVLDLACGSGMQTLHLAELLPTAFIIGVESHQPFVEEARRRIVAAAISERVDCLPGDMGDLDMPPESIDLIWCEGAAYIIGVERALSLWKPLLSDNGVVAFSDAVFLTDKLAKDVTDFWQAYPDMQTVARRREQIVAWGYELLGDFVLPKEAWWDDYYKPMQANIDSLRNDWSDQPNLLNVLAAMESEITLFQNYADQYGYAFFVARKPDL